MDFKRIAPNYPCVLGVVPVGLSSPESVSDGHKFTCGIHAIERQPIVYSFGSHQQQDFELAFLRLRPDAEIHIFEIDPTQLPAMQLRHESIRYNAVGLGYVNSDGFTVKSLKDIMEQNNHKYIDVLKMDVEGQRVQFFENRRVLCPSSRGPVSCRTARPHDVCTTELSWPGRIHFFSRGREIRIAVIPPRGQRSRTAVGY